MSSQGTLILLIHSRLIQNIDQEGPVSLLQRFSKTTKRILALPNNNHPTPSPTTK